MEKTLRAAVLMCLAFLTLNGLAQSPAKPLVDPIKLFSDWQDHYAKAKDYSGTFRMQKGEGERAAGTFIVRGERFRLVFADKEITSDGVYLWEVNHRDHRVKRRHYDPYEAPAVVQLFRLVRLDMTSEVVGIASTGTPVVYLEIETGASVAQGSHALDIDPKTLEATGIRTHVNQGSWLESCEVAQVKMNQGFAEETFTVVLDNYKGKGYTFIDMAKGENLTVLPEERALFPFE
jgi:outer membrane lipoprotein-sorting protein